MGHPSSLPLSWETPGAEPSQSPPPAASSKGRNFSFPELDQLCTPGSGSVLALPCPWDAGGSRCIQPSPAPPQDPGTLGCWDGAQGTAHCQAAAPLLGRAVLPSTAISPGGLDRQTACRWLMLSGAAGPRGSGEVLSLLLAEQSSLALGHCTQPWGHSRSLCCIPNQQGTGINGKRSVLPSGGGEANALHFQDIHRAQASREAVPKPLPSPLAEGQGGNPLQPLESPTSPAGPAAPLPWALPAGLPWPGSRSSWCKSKADTPEGERTDKE